MAANTRIEVVSPVANALPPKALTPASRPDSLDGKTICLWWNSKSRGDVALTTVTEILERRFKNVNFVRFSQQYDHGRNFPERYAEVRKSGAVVAIATTAD